MEERVDALISSTAVSFVFPVEELDGMALVDGSLFTTISIGDPISRCREEVENDSDIIVDVIMCYTEIYPIEKLTFAETRWMTAYDFYARRKEIFRSYYYKEDFTLLERSFKDVNFRIYIEPSVSLTGSKMVPINGNADDFKFEMNIGYEDGKKVVDAYKQKVYEES